MDTKNPINSNENIVFREAYREPDLQGRSQEYLLPFVPLAQLIIKRHSPDNEWKHFSNHHQFIFKEYKICTILFNEQERTRDHIIELVAAILSINPLSLFNDPDLPF